MISIAEIKKPLSAYQYYTKSMRENWNNLSEESREIYTARATKDKERYEKEKEAILERKREETRAKKIFLGRSYGRVPCVGLDVGFSTSEAIGPAEQVVEYDKEEQEKYGIKYKIITIGSISWKHNRGYWRKRNSNVYTAGRAWKNTPLMWSLSSSQEQYHIQYYHDCYGKKWREKRQLSMWAVK